MYIDIPYHHDFAPFQTLLMIYFYVLLDDVAAGHRFHPGLTGRGVTIATLMTENIIKPGEKVMSLEYLVR